MSETTVTLENEKSVEKAYEFRKLSSVDIFLMFKIIGKIGLNEFTACLEKDGVKNMLTSMTGKEKNVEMIGISLAVEIANVIFNNLPKCESEIYQLLAQTSNLTVNEIKAEGNAIMFVEMIIDFIKKEEFPDFIKVVSKLFK